MENNEQEIRGLAQAWVKGFIERDPDIYARVFHDDVVVRDAHILLEGLEQFKASSLAFRNAFGDLKLEHGYIVVDGDMISSVFRLRGQHVAPLMGIPATHAEIEIAGTGIFRFDDGKFRECWHSMDLSQLLRAAGIDAGLPPPGPAQGPQPPERPWIRRWKLSPRYAEVAELVMQGRADKEVADQLGLSHATARTYVRELFRLAGVGNRSELLEAAGVVTLG